MSHSLQRRAVRLNLHSEVTSAQIGKVLEEIYRLSGCLACGIRGIDLVLQGGDPEIDVLGRLQGVTGARTAPAI